MRCSFLKKETSEDKLKIIKGRQRNTLPAAWSLSDAGSYDFNSKMEDRAFAHGGDVIGDGLVKGHTIKVKFSPCRQKRKQCMMNY